MDAALGKISTNVVVGARSHIHPTALVGLIGRAGDSQTIIGEDSEIASGTVIYAGARFGAGLRTGHGAVIHENNAIGDRSIVGTYATLGPGNRIGKHCCIHTGCFLENVTLGDDVFIGPNVVFTDDPHPPCRECAEFVGGATVGDGASIGANSTILPGVKIGAGALVGAGSVVTKDVPPAAVVAGNPARVIKDVSEVHCRAKHR